MTFSASESELPIIDFSKDAMKHGTTTWDLTRKHVLKALEEYGCFKATFNEINNELYTNLFSSLEKLFDLPKNTSVASLPTSLTKDIYRICLEHLLMRPWESLIRSTFRQFRTSLSLCGLKEMPISDLEKTVRKMIYESYGVGRYFEEESKSMKCSIRLMKYDAPMKDEDTLGAFTHYDKNFITILQENGVGLQVQDKDGKWINAKPSCSSLIVQLGESFYGWSNGRLKCCLHRVRTSGFKSRYSVGFFTSKEGTVKIHSELVDDQHLILFKPFDQTGLLQVFRKQMEDYDYTCHDDNIVPIVASHFSV